MLRVAKARPAVLLGAVLVADCVAPAARPRTAGPPHSLALERSWDGEPRVGLVASMEWFTAAELADPRWEKARRDQARFVSVCSYGHRFIARDVRWWPATRVSGQACARVVYTITCLYPERGGRALLEKDRAEALATPPRKQPEAACGEKDYDKRHPPRAPTKPLLNKPS